MTRAFGALFAALCLAGLVGTVYAAAATPNPAYVAVVCGLPALAAGVAAWIMWVAAVEERRERSGLRDTGEPVPDAAHRGDDLPVGNR